MDKQDTDNSKMQLITKGEIIVFSVIGLFLLFIPLALTQNSIFSQFDFTDSGSIGDTIGGTTAPFIGFFAAVLVYLSFRQQLRANEIIMRANDKQDQATREGRRFDTLMKLIETLDTAIYQFEYRTEKKAEGKQNVIRGVDGIQYTANKFHQNNGERARKFLEYHENRDESVPYFISMYSQLWRLTNLLSYISTRIDSAEIDFELKEELMLRLDMSYRTK